MSLIEHVFDYCNVDLYYMVVLMIMDSNACLMKF